MTFNEFKLTDDFQELSRKLYRQLKIRGVPVEDFTNEDLGDEIEDAINAINSRRKFKTTSEHFYDLAYRGMIVDLSVAAILKMGAEGQTSHSENGTSRSYKTDSKYPVDMLAEIVPLARIR